MVLCGEATVLDIALCIVKGLVVQSLISCVTTAVFGEAAVFMLKLAGIGQDTYGLIEAIKSKFHPFYVKNDDGTGEWKAASNLKAGDELLSEDGNKVKVSEVKVEKLAEEITVYKLELDEVHTYFVPGGVLVHNGYGKIGENGTQTMSLLLVKMAKQRDLMLKIQNQVK